MLNAFEAITMNVTNMMKTDNFTHTIRNSDTIHHFCAKRNGGT